MMNHQVKTELLFFDLTFDFPFVQSSGSCRREFQKDSEQMLNATNTNTLNPPGDFNKIRSPIFYVKYGEWEVRTKISLRNASSEEFMGD